MTDTAKTGLGGWIVALGWAGVVVGAVLLTSGDLGWPLAVSFGAGFALLCLGGVVMGSAGKAYRRRLLGRWGYVAGLTQGGWDPERTKKPQPPRSS
jgi:hypothetical protein